jgi:hypothetical protein
VRSRGLLEVDSVIGEICGLRWQELTEDELLDVAWAYYFFSIQFRENLQIARSLYPGDDNLRRLEHEECGTDNLSPWPGVAAPGEKMNHDEFMRRVLLLSEIASEKQRKLESLGHDYLRTIREINPMTRALSISSYEDGGLERVFGAILKARCWESESLRAFKHFLDEHIKFDSNPEQGHGALSRHLAPDDRVLPLWIAFRDILVAAVPSLSREAQLVQ